MDYATTDLLFCDLETGGLDPAACAILEVAAIRIGMNGNDSCSYESKVIPVPGKEMQPAAIKINGYTKRKWARAKSLRSVLKRLAPLIEGAIFAGQNPHFDWSFLCTAFRECEIPLPRLASHHMLDVASLVWPIVSLGYVDSPSLKDTAPYFFVSNRGAHRAMRDVERTIEVYQGYMSTLAI